MSLFIPLLLLLSQIVSAAQDCRFPNGTVGTYFPCNESAENSACCGGSDVCLTNGYCFQQNNASESWGLRIARGMCTNWEASGSDCPELCADVATNGTVTVFMVHDYPTALFCCSSYYDPSTDECGVATRGNNRPFALPLGQAIYDRKTGATVQLDYEATPATNTSSGTAVTVTATPKSNSDTAAVAAGIAVPLGILLLCALAAIAILWRKLKRAQRTNEDHASQLLHSADSKSNSPYYDTVSGGGNVNNYNHNQNNGDIMQVQGYPAAAWRQPSMQQQQQQPPVHELPHAVPQAELGTDSPTVQGYSK